MSPKPNYAKPLPAPKRTVDDMMPEDIHAKAIAEIERLDRVIAHSKSTVTESERLLAYWRRVAQLGKADQP